MTTITANDVDSSPALTYRFGNATDPGPFSIDRYGGKVVLRRRLDAETRSEYSLQVIASDGIHEATTDLIVRVTDLNDNAPRFQQSAYIATLPGKFLSPLLSSLPTFPIPGKPLAGKPFLAGAGNSVRSIRGRGTKRDEIKREFKNWFLVDTRCLVARVPNSN